MRTTTTDIVTALVDRACDTPSAPYLTTIADGESTTLTFAEAEAAARRSAARLIAEHDVAPGSLIALRPRNDAASVIEFLGAQFAGCGVLMLDPGISERHRTTIARTHGACLILDAGAPAQPVSVGTIDTAVAGSLDATAVVFNTSGSTSVPKAVALPHSAVMANAASFTAHHGLSSIDRILTCLPIHHSNAVNTCLISPLVSGGHSILVPPDGLLDLPRSIMECEPTILSVVPSLLDVLAKIWRYPRAPATLRYVLTAAAPLTAMTVERVRDRIGIRVVQAYGLTETVNFSTTIPVDLSPEDYVDLMVRTATPSVGVALPGVEVTVRDGDGRLLPPGVTGEVCMAGAALMRGYVGDPTATAKVLRDGHFRSGDLGHFERHASIGDLLFLSGRIKNIVKVRGEQVSFEEVEHALRALAGVLDAGCVAVPDVRDGERVVAAICADGASPRELMARMAAEWPRRMVPKDIVIVDEIPRTATGKIVRTELRRRLGL